MGAVLAIFPIFLGFVGIFWDPGNYFADLGAILAIFDHFWDHFWAEKKMAFFADKWHFGPGIRAESQNPRIRKSV